MGSKTYSIENIDPSFRTKNNLDVFPFLSHSKSLTFVFVICSRQKDYSVQIIGMSATLPNLNLLAEWLSADLYQTEFRPVPLSEHIKIGNKLFDSKFQFVRDLNPEVKINVIVSSDIFYRLHVQNL